MIGGNPGVMKILLKLGFIWQVLVLLDDLRFFWQIWRKNLVVLFVLVEILEMINGLPAKSDEELVMIR